MHGCICVCMHRLVVKNDLGEWKGFRMYVYMHGCICVCMHRLVVKNDLGEWKGFGGMYVCMDAYMYVCIVG